MTKAASDAKSEPSRQEVVTARVTEAYEAARDKVSGAGRDALSALESNPLAALLGGLALGAVAGALIPRSEREKTLLEPLGGKLAAAAAAAIAAGREAGIEALKDSGLETNKLRDQVSTLFGEAAKAAGTAGTAALAAARESVAG